MIAKYAVKYVVESSSFIDWSTRLKWLPANITHIDFPTANHGDTGQIQLYL
jgi:hypothetical protein